MQYGIRVANGDVITDPDWMCVADVMRSLHHHADGQPGPAHGHLVRRDTPTSPWEVA